MAAVKACPDRYWRSRQSSRGPSRDSQGRTRPRTSRNCGARGRRRGSEASAPGRRSRPPKMRVPAAELHSAERDNFFMYCIQYCFICRPSDSTVSEDAGIEPRTVATTALAVRRSNLSAKSHPQSARSHPLSAKSHPPARLNLIHTRLNLIHVQYSITVCASTYSTT